MTSEERTAWLAGLKVGDEVADWCIGTPEKIADIETVTKITPKQIHVGYCGKNWKRSGIDVQYPNRMLIPVDHQMIERRDRLKLSRDLSEMSHQAYDLPITTVRKLLAVLAEAEQEKEDGK